MKHPFVLAISLSLLSIPSHAQDHSLPGYIVRVSGDTVHGFLKEQGTDESARRISFKGSASDNTYQVYTPAEVKAFQYDNGNLFRGITYPDTRKEEGTVTRTCYGKLLVAGEFDLYSFTEDGVLYFVVRKDDDFYMIYDDDIRSLPYVKGNFRNELNFFAVSCDEAKKEIERADYSMESLVNFFQKLDACVNPNRTVQTYYHKAKGTVGVFAYVGGIPLGQQSQFTAEIRMRVVWPQLDPKVSFNVGYRHATIVTRVVDPSYLVAKIYHQETYQINSLPLTIQYNLLRGAVQPFVYAGLSMLTVNIITDLTLSGADPYYQRWGIAGLVGAGVEVKITHFLKARAEWRYEYMSEFPTAGLALTLP